MGHTPRDAAETIVFGLEENDKVSSAEILEESTDAFRAVIAIEMDTGEQFFAEVLPA